MVAALAWLAGIAAIAQLLGAVIRLESALQILEIHLGDLADLEQQLRSEAGLPLRLSVRHEFLKAADITIHRADPHRERSRRFLNGCGVRGLSYGAEAHIERLGFAPLLLEQARDLREGSGLAFGARRPSEP